MMNSVRGVTLVIAMLSQALLVCPTYADQNIKSIRGATILSDTKSEALQLTQGFVMFVPLDFVPLLAAVGDPEVLGLDVVEGGANPQLKFVGVGPGATNVVVFDKSHKARVVMEVTVNPTTYGTVEKISVYRQNIVENIGCTAGNCRKLDGK